MEEVQKQVSQDHGKNRLLVIHPWLHEVIASCAADLLCHELGEAAAVRLRDQGKCTGGLESSDCALQATETIGFMGEHLGPAARSSDRSEAKHCNPVATLSLVCESLVTRNCPRPSGRDWRPSGLKDVWGCLGETVLGIL